MQGIGPDEHVLEEAQRLVLKYASHLKFKLSNVQANEQYRQDFDGDDEGADNEGDDSYVEVDDQYNPISMQHVTQRRRLNDDIQPSSSLNLSGNSMIGGGGSIGNGTIATGRATGSIDPNSTISSSAQPQVLQQHLKQQ